MSNELAYDDMQIMAHFCSHWQQPETDCLTQQRKLETVTSEGSQINSHLYLSSFRQLSLRLGLKGCLAPFHIMCKFAVFSLRGLKQS